MDVSGGVVGKYHIVDQVQEISHHSPEIKALLNVAVVKVFQPRQPHLDTYICCRKGLSLCRNVHMTHQQDLYCLSIKK